MTLNSDDLNELLNDAFEHLEKGRSRMALVAAKKAYEQSPEYVNGIACFAWALLENGYVNQSLEMINYAVQISPESPIARLYRGYLLMRMGIFDGAISDLDFALAKKSEHSLWGHLNKARALAGLNRFFEGLEEIEKAMRLNKDGEIKLEQIKEWFKIILNNDPKSFRKNFFIQKKTLIEEAICAFKEKEYWFSLWASREIIKSGNQKEYTEAQILELETMAAMFQFRPALVKAEQAKNSFLGIDKFYQIYQRLKKSNSPESLNYQDEKIVFPDRKRTDFQKYESKVFDILHAKTYNLIENLRSGKRTYLLEFNEEEIRYIGVEIVIDNPFFNNKRAVVEGTAVWYLNNEEVGRHQFELPIEKEWPSVEFVQSWGTDTPGFWKKGQAKVDIYINASRVCTRYFFIDKADVVNFEISDNKEEKYEHQEHPDIEQPSNVQDISSKPQEEKSLEELLVELDSFTGLSRVKQSMRDFVDYLKFLNERRSLGIKTEENFSVHCVFTGNPGTGKTTVARLLGKIFKAMGLLKNGHVIEVDRTGLVGQYVGETAQKTDKVIKEAIGGLLFIDEAYALKKTGTQSDFGQEAIDVLLKRMEDMAGEFVVIAAGYPEEMDSFIGSNPGLKSRFTHFFNFEDYTPDELIDIFKLTSAKEEYNVDSNALDVLKKELVKLYRKRDKTFGNARLVRNLFNESKMQLSKRYIKMASNERTKEAMTTILRDDVVSVLNSSSIREFVVGIDEDNLQKHLERLNNLTGLETVKKEINELVKVAKYYIEQGENPQDKFNSHIVFVGNPGTGKTTVARYFSEIYSALGILPRGHLVEADRQALVASYVGQTAQKTKEVIDKSIGGTLFIDEAYTLTKKGESNENDFGHEAIDTLLKRMEDDRGKFLVIAAGYTDNMNHFLDSNPGLQSRFTKKILFDDYTPDELLTITEKYMKEKGHTIDEEAYEPLRKYYNKIYSERDKSFGNARVVRNLVDNAIKKHLLRLADIPAEERHEETIRLIGFEDIKGLILPKKEKENIKVEGDPQLLNQYLDELANLTGLDSVKLSVKKLINSLKVAKLREQRGFKVIPKNLHVVFAGNPGTGKTTVARLLSKIYKELGILDKGHLVETDRAGMVAGYIGQTAAKTDALIQRALGGILFIDEAHALSRGSNDSGNEAVETLLKRMEEYAGKFICIAAGNTNEMKQFIDSFPGIQSKFANIFSFEDFTPRQLLEIALDFSNKNGYMPDEGALQLFHEIFTELYKNKNETFGNARTVRNIFYKAVSNQEERILNIFNPDDEALCTITFEDVEKIDLKEI